MPVPSNYFTSFCWASCDKIEVKILTDRQIDILAPYMWELCLFFYFSIKFATSLLFLLVCPNNNPITHICFCLPSYELNLEKVNNNKNVLQKTVTKINCLHNFFLGKLSLRIFLDKVNNFNPKRKIFLKRNWITNWLRFCIFYINLWVKL